MLDPTDSGGNVIKVDFGRPESARGRETGARASEVSAPGTGSSAELDCQARSVARILRRFSDAVTRAIREPKSIDIGRDLKQISRAHLVIEWDGCSAVDITDLSSTGTFVGRFAVEG